MKILIVEDEPFAADALAAIIKKLRAQAEILTSLGSIEETVDWLKSHQPPGLIFCDIHLSDGNSFEIFRQVEVKCPVIFTTAYNQYALEAFKVNSIDYLLKPIKPEEVARALDKFENLQQQQLAQSLVNLQQLLQTSPAQPQPQNFKSRFMVKHGQGLKAIALEDVAYFWAEEGVVFLVTNPGKRYIINYTLEQLEEQVDPQLFFRANRQMMLHIKSVQEVRPYFKGRLSLVLNPSTTEEVIVSSSKSHDFKNWLEL